MQNRHHSRKRWVSVLVGALLAGVAGAVPAATTAPVVDPTNPPYGPFVDEWYAVMLTGKKSGQMHNRMDRIKSPQGDLIVTQIKMQMRVQRAGIEVAVATYSKTTETLDGHPVAFVRKTYLGEQPVTTEGTVENGQVTIVSSQFGQRLPPRTYRLPEGAMMDWAVFKQQFKRGLKAGTRYTVPMYEPSISPERLCPAEVEVFGSEMVDLFGRKVKAVKTRQVMRIPKGSDDYVEQKTTSWITHEGQTVRLQMSVLDIPVEVIACPKSIAMSPDEPAELMLDMVLPLNRQLDPDRLRKVTYRIRFKGDPNDNPLSSFPETTIQRVIQRRNNEIVLQVTRLSALSETVDPAAGLSAQDKARYLRATSVLNYKDPKVAELARQAAGEETEPHRLARRLVDFVDEHVSQKNFDIGFATASEVARSREGDCTEHGVLLAALGRARGIPTRLVTGLVYADSFAGKRNILAGHLWTEFWIDGRWVDLDATRRQTDLDPTHIALAISAADDAGFADLIASTWLNIPRLQIEVIAVEPE